MIIVIFIRVKINVNKFNHADRPAIKNKFFCGVKNVTFWNILNID